MFVITDKMLHPDYLPEDPQTMGDDGPPPPPARGRRASLFEVGKRIAPVGSSIMAHICEPVPESEMVLNIRQPKVSTHLSVKPPPPPPVLLPPLDTSLPDSICYKSSSTIKVKWQVSEFHEPLYIKFQLHCIYKKKKKKKKLHG